MRPPTKDANKILELIFQPKEEDSVPRIRLPTKKNNAKSRTRKPTKETNTASRIRPPCKETNRRGGLHKDHIQYAGDNVTVTAVIHMENMLSCEDTEQVIQYEDEMVFVNHRKIPAG